MCTLGKVKHRGENKGQRKKTNRKKGEGERGGVSAGGSRREKGGLCRWRAGHGREEGGCLRVLWMGGWSAVEMGEGI